MLVQDGCLDFTVCCPLLRWDRETTSTILLMKSFSYFPDMPYSLWDEGIVTRESETQQVVTDPQGRPCVCELTSGAFLTSLF